MANGLLQVLGLKKKAAASSTLAPPVRTAGDSASAAPPDAPTIDAFSLVRKPTFLDPSGPEMRNALYKGLEEKAQKDKQEAEQTLAKMDKALADVTAYVAGLSDDVLRHSSYAAIMTDVRKRFPEAAGLSQWVNDTSRKVPELQGKLPSPQAVMSIVESRVKSRGIEMGWSLATGKDMATVATDRLLAAYVSQLPPGVSATIDGGVVKLSLAGAAISVETPAGAVDASANKGGTAIALKNDDFAIQVANDGWKEFDPQLRAQWQKIGDASAVIVKLKAARDKAKLELESKKKDGATVTADLQADFDKREAAFNLAWTKLQEKVTATAKASADKIAASVAYLKKDKADKDSVKAGIDAEVDLKALQAKLDAYYKTPTLEAVLEVAAAADKVSAKLEVTAAKTGVVVTASFEKALDETKAAIDVMLREGKTQIAAELKKKADDLSAKLKVVQQTKDVKLAGELEKTLKDVRGTIDVEVSKGQATIKGSASGSSTGEVGGKVQVDIALEQGRTFADESAKLSFAANVSTRGYKFEVTFSMGEPVDTPSLQDLFGNADWQIKELYRLAGDKGIRSIQDAEELNRKLQTVMAPIKDSARKAKTLKKKSDISASFGFSIEGEWPAAGKAPPPAALFSATIRF